MELIEQIKNGELNEADLLEYITDNDISIAMAVASSEYATEPILDIAAHDRNRNMRLAAVNNPNVGTRTLKYLCNDDDVEVSALAKEFLGRRTEK